MHSSIETFFDDRNPQTIVEFIMRDDDDLDVSDYCANKGHDALVVKSFLLNFKHFNSFSTAELDWECEMIFPTASCPEWGFDDRMINRARQDRIEQRIDGISCMAKNQKAILKILCQPFGLKLDCMGPSFGYDGVETDWDIWMDRLQAFYRYRSGAMCLACERHKKSDTDIVCLLWAKNQPGVNEVYARVPKDIWKMIVSKMRCPKCIEKRRISRI